MEGPRTLAVDIGGTGVKLALLDGKGRIIGKNIRVPTPMPPVPPEVLTATIEDPSPVEYPEPGGAERGRMLATGLTDAQRDEILSFIDKAWDDEHGGWSKSKFVDGPMLAWALQRARGGDRENEARIRKTLTLMATTMIDKTSAP